jgi:hypothetical protein
VQDAVFGLLINTEFIINGIKCIRAASSRQVAIRRYLQQARLLQMKMHRYACD